MKEKKAQCYSGALFAAAALRELGFGARIVWFDAVNDDGHCIAIYEREGSWGPGSESRQQRGDWFRARPMEVFIPTAHLPCLSHMSLE